MAKQKQSFTADLISGPLIGFLATQALDVLSAYLYEHEDEKTYKEENAARQGHHAYENAILKLANFAHVSLSEKEVREYAWSFHRIFGTAGGIQYLLLRRKFPAIGAGFGLAWGFGFFLLVDEILIPALGLTPGPQKFSWKVHARGLAAHVAYGVALELSARLIESASHLSEDASRYAKASSTELGHSGQDLGSGYPKKSKSLHLLN